MRPTGHVTAVMVLAAFAAVGCSKQEQASQAVTESAEVAPKTPMPKTAAAFPDEEGFDSGMPAPISSSFADGEAAFNARKYGEATAIFESYVARRPTNPWGHYMLGLSAWKAGDLSKSKHAFEQALNLDDSHVKSLVNESRLFIDQQRYDEAIDRLVRASEVDPGSAVVFRLLARTYAAKGETEKAVETYRAAIDVNGDDVWSMNNLGLLLVDARRADEALPLLAKAVALRKDVAEFHNNLGMALEHTGRFKAAAKAYGDALTTNPAYAKAKNNLARVDAVRSGPEEPFDVEQAAKLVEPATKDADLISATADIEQAAIK